MERFVFVECHADRYFFGKLIQSEVSINKEADKDTVIKRIIEYRKNVFTIAIIDKDKTELRDKFLKSKEYQNVEIEDGLSYGEEMEVFKIANRPLFIIQICPIEFEKWINDFLVKNGKQIEDFGFDNLKDFEENHCKKHFSKLVTDDKFKEVMKFVLSNFENNDNSVRKMKQVLMYLINDKYNSNMEKLKEIFK